MAQTSNRNSAGQSICSLWLKHQKGTQLVSQSVVCGSGIKQDLNWSLCSLWLRYQTGFQDGSLQFVAHTSDRTSTGQSLGSHALLLLLGVYTIPPLIRTGNALPCLGKDAADAGAALPSPVILVMLWVEVKGRTVLS